MLPCIEAVNLEMTVANAVVKRAVNSAS